MLDPLKKTVRLSLADEHLQALARYMNAADMHSQSDAIRAIILEHGAATMMDGAILSARYQAYMEASRYLYSHMQDFLAQMSKDIRGK